MDKRERIFALSALPLLWCVAAYQPAPVFKASGTSHATGVVPDPGSTAGTVRYLREDATWASPPGTNGTLPSGQFTTQRLVTAAYTLTTSDGVLVANAASGSFNVTLPAAPASGTLAFIIAVDGNAVNLFSTSNNINNGGSLTNSENLGANTTVCVWYDSVSSTKRWRIAAW